MTAVDEKAQDLWEDYTNYKKRTFDATDTKSVPWTIIDANQKGSARLEAIRHILEAIPYK